MNVREKLESVAHYLGWQDEDFVCGIRSMTDAIKLWEFSQSSEGSRIDEMCDNWPESQLVKVIGYNPWKEVFNHD